MNKRAHRSSVRIKQDIVNDLWCWHYREVSSRPTPEIEALLPAFEMRRGAPDRSRGAASQSTNNVVGSRR